MITSRAQLSAVGACVLDLRGNAASVLCFVNTQLPYLSVQLFAVPRALSLSLSLSLFLSRAL